MKNARALAVLNVISFLLHLVVVFLVQSRTINEKNVGEVSDQYPSLFTPSGFTFGIWGIIYTTLSIFCVYHMVMAFKRNDNDANRDLRSIGLMFFINNIATAGWLLAWTKELILAATLLIIIQLLTLIIIHKRLHIHNRNRTPGSKLATEFPLSIYLGWICVATIANISVYLVAIGWNGLGIPGETWTIIMMSIVIMLALFMVLRRNNIVFGLVTIWALYGIISNLNSKGFSNGGMIVAAWTGVALLILACLFQIVRSIRSLRVKREQH